MIKKFLKSFLRNIVKELTKRDNLTEVNACNNLARNADYWKDQTNADFKAHCEQYKDSYGSQCTYCEKANACSSSDDYCY